jgi:uncharacterized protein YbjT (DUF2867 family)
MNASEILVTGGSGSLGGRVVNRLRDAGHEVRALSRNGRSGTVRGDLMTGEGLKEAVEGVDVIVHCASSPTKTRQIDVEGTERLLKAANRAGVSNFVFISIVGVDRNPYYPYYRMKLEIEQMIEASPVPWTILRATQFHEFLFRFVRLLSRAPVALAPKGFLLQPIDIGEVADRLAELTFSGAAGRVPDVGGPEVDTFANFARAYFKAIGRSRKVVEVPVPGKMARAWRKGAQVCPDQRYGRITWDEFLSLTVNRTKTGETARR